MTVVIILGLLLSEVYYFLQVDQKDEMVVDFAQDQKKLEGELTMTVRYYYQL